MGLQEVSVGLQEVSVGLQEVSVGLQEVSMTERAEVDQGFLTEATPGLWWAGGGRGSFPTS